jgi:high-affinity nickel permease
MTTTNPETQEMETREGEHPATAARHAAEGVAANLTGAASTVGARLPEAAATTRAAVDEAARRMATGSDQMLTVGTSFSLGLTIGLMIGGANRILVTLAMIPAAAMGMTLLDRTSEGRSRRTPA